MRNKIWKQNMKKGVLYSTFACTVLSLCLYGCGRAEPESNAEPASVKQEQKAESGVSPAETTEIETEPDGEQGVETKEGQKIMFPEKFSETIGNVTFNMDIVVNGDLTDASVVTAKAQMQKVNQEKAFELFYSDITAYETYDYEEEDEYGKMAHSVTYVSPEETTLTFGPVSSKLEYMERDLMPAVRNTFVTFEDDRYNADLYSTEGQLSFMTREEAFATVQKTLQALDINMETDYAGYALDYKTMQTQEYYEDMNGNIDKSQYKAQWSGADDCYYFYIDQIYRGLPFYHVYNKVFGDAGEIHAPVQAVVSAEGIEYFEIEKVFAVSEEKGGVSLADMDMVVKTAADKFNQVLGDTAYEITKAQLYYYVDLSSGTGVYDVKPAWILSGSEKGGKRLQMIIDAQTAEEILPKV